MRVIKDALAKIRTAPFTPVIIFVTTAGVLLMLREISAVLARLESTGLPSFDMGALTGWHWPPWDNTDVVAALKTWAMADKSMQEQGISAGLPTSWIGWHLLVDSVLLVPIYLVVSMVALCWLVKTRRLTVSWVLALPPLLAVVDIIENIATWTLVDPAISQLSGGAETLSRPLNGRANFVGIVTDLKWALTGLLLVVLVTGLLRREEGHVFWWPMVAGRVSALRVPLITVSILAFLLVVPGGGALDQLPDILRAQSDTASWWNWIGSWPAVSVMAFAVVVWLAGWIAATADDPVSRKAERIGWLFPGMCVVGIAAAWLVWFLLKDGKWPALVATAGIFVLPGLLLAACALVLLVRGLVGSGNQGKLAELFSGERPPPGVVGQDGRALAAIVVAIGGLAIIRAFVAPALTAPLVDDDVDIPASWWLRVGWVAAVLGAVVAWVVLGFAERWFAARTRRPTAQQSVPAGPVGEGPERRPPDSTDVVMDAQGGHGAEAGPVAGDVSGYESASAPGGAVRPKVVWAARTLLVVGVVGCGLLAFSPEAAEPLGPHGVIVLVLAVATLAAVMVDTSTMLSLNPGPVARGLGFRTRPVFLTLLAVFVLAGQFDDVVRYHAVRLDAPDERTIPSQANEWLNDSDSLDTEFNSWSKAATACIAKQVVQTPRPKAIPLVLIAAPGGGIRAAYWTANAMHGLAKVACGMQFAFAASGVSGGSIGLATWSADPNNAPANVRKLSNWDPLAQLMAAMLLRDLPRGFTGLHPSWPDRGAVFEDAWSASVPTSAGGDRPLERSFGTLGPTSETWSPHLVLSGTDLQRGCRVVATTLPISLTTPAVAAEDPQKAVDPGRCSASPDPVSQTTSNGFASGTLDVRELVNEEPCPTQQKQEKDLYLRISTAAHLSARFPLVSPTGGLVVCHYDSGERQAMQVLVGDGGYRDNTALTALLELWSKLEPLVAKHNLNANTQRKAAKKESGAAKSKIRAEELNVVPMFIVLENHYRSQARGTIPERTPEIQAILEGASARQHPTSEGVLEQRVAVEATEPIPGFGCTSGKQRWFIVAPRKGPESSAPLGWVLSHLSRQSLDSQLSTQLGNVTRALEPKEVVQHLCSAP